MRKAPLIPLLLLAACSADPSSRALIDVRALREAAALSFTPIDRLEIVVDAADLAPVRVAVDPRTDTFEMTLAPGPARRFVLEAVRDLNGREVPVYFGQTVADLAPGDVEIVIGAYPVGLLELTILDGAAAPMLAPVDLRIGTSGAIPGLHEAEIATTVGTGQLLQVVRPGAVTIAGPTLAFPGDSNVTVAQGQVTPATIYAVTLVQKCAADSAAALRALAPTCRTITVDVSGATGAGTVVELLDANGASLESIPVALGTARVTFQQGVADGTTYGIAVTGSPAGQECILQGAATLVASTDATHSVVCGIPMYDVTLDVRGLMGTGLEVLVSDAAGAPLAVTFDADGVQVLRNLLPDGAALSVYIEGGQPTVGWCTVNSPDAMIFGDVTVTVLCAGPVEPFYTNAPRWTDFAQSAGGRSAPVCVKDVDPRSTCVHGGERKLVEVRDLTSCAGLSIVDTAGAFDWTCVDPDAITPGVWIVSTGLKPGRGLKDLLLGGAIASHSVVITQGAQQRSTEASVWWSNPVVVVSTQTAAPAAAPYDIWVVSTPSGTFTAPTEHFTLVVEDGSPIAADFSSPAFAVGGNDHVWLEGELLNAMGYVVTLEMGTGAYATANNVIISGGAPCVAASARDLLLRDVQASGCQSVGGIVLDGAGSRITLEDVTVAGANGAGLRSSAAGVQVRKSRFISGTSEGVLVDGGPFLMEDSVTNNNDLDGVNLNGVGLTNVILRRLIASDNGGSGITVSNAANTMVSQLVAVANDGHGLLLNQSPRGVFSDLTLVSNGASGLELQAAAANNTISRAVAAASNTGLGIATGATANVFVDVAAINCGTAINAAGTDSQFHGVLLVTNPNGCAGNGDRGLVIGTCTTTGQEGSSTYGAGSSSTATLGINRDVGGAFVAKVTSDAVNQSTFDAFGQTNAGVADWGHFENAYRAFILYDGTSAWPDTMLARRCGFESTCELYDWRTIATGQLSGVLSAVPASASVRTHVWFTPAAPTSQEQCEQFVPGSIFSGPACVSNFIDHARELPGIGTNDGNGLCEAGETCVEAVNLGAYQGEGGQSAPRTVDVGGGSVQLSSYAAQATQI